MKLLLLSSILLSGCAHYQYQPVDYPQQSNSFSQATYDMAQFNNSLAELISSSYPTFYAISALTQH